MNVLTPEDVQIHAPESSFQARIFLFPTGIGSAPRTIMIDMPGARTVYIHTLNVHTDANLVLKFDGNAAIPFQTGIIYRGFFRKLRIIHMSTLFSKSGLIVWSGDRYFDVDRAMKQVATSAMARTLYE